MADQDDLEKAFPDGEFTDAELKDLGRCNALTNQEAKLVLKQFSSANTSANKLWAPPALAQKAMDYLDKVEQKTDVQHRETVGRFREVQHRAQLYEYEMALLANLTPERVEEATTLVPSLKERFAGEKQQILEHALEEIATIKQMQ